MAAGYPKPYQKHEQMSHVTRKQYKQSKQFPNKWVQEELPFEDKPWREHPLTDTEIEKLFWRELVQLGWRIHSYLGGGENKRTIVLPCPYCNKVIDLYTWDWCSKADASKMSNAEYVKQRIKEHEADCKALPEEGDTDV